VKDGDGECHPGSGNATGRTARAPERFGKGLRYDQLFQDDRLGTRRFELPVVSAARFGIDQRLVRFASALKLDWRGAGQRPPTLPLAIQTLLGWTLCGPYSLRSDRRSGTAYPQVLGRLVGTARFELATP
jgi:hypothetical protein